MRDEELTSVIDEVRIRVRARYPEQPLDNNPTNDSALPNLMPLLRARDAAEAKVAAIGTVNPRLPGIVNAAIQRGKRIIARGMDWHVREQVVFNRAAMDCVQAALEALTDANRALAKIESATSHDLAAAEKSSMLVLRTIADVQALLQQRTTELEEDFRQSSSAHHAAFEESLARSVAQIRRETERLIHTELRLIRQRSSTLAERSTAPGEAEFPLREPGFHPAPGAPGHPVPAIDWLKFADVFRGPEEQIRARHRRHVHRFAACSEVLDIGCGRGEFLQVAQDAGIRARGIDQNPECVALCLAKGHATESADLFAYLDTVEDGTLPGVFCAHVVEHLDPLLLPGLISLLSRKMQPEGVIVIETPNPEDAETMARYFWIDPTHIQPVPSALLRFYLEETGFGNIEIESGPDYVASAAKLGPSGAGLGESVKSTV